MMQATTVREPELIAAHRECTGIIIDDDISVETVECQCKSGVDPTWHRAGISSLAQRFCRDGSAGAFADAIRFTIEGAAGVWLPAVAIPENA